MEESADLAGYVYLSLFVIMWIRGSMQGNRRKRLIEQSPPTKEHVAL